MWIRLLFCLLIVSGMSGCQMLDMKKDCHVSKQVETKIAVRDNIDDVRMIAERLGIEVSQGKTASDVATDIRFLIDDSEYKMPKAFPDAVIDRLEKLLNSEERKLLREYQQAIREAQGKVVLYLPER